MPKKVLTKHVSIDTIQRQIGDLIPYLQSGDYRFVVQDNDRPIAILLSPDEFEDYLDLVEADTQEIQSALTQSEDDHAKGRVGTLHDLYKSLKM